MKVTATRTLSAVLAALAARSLAVISADVTPGGATIEGGLDAGNPRRPRPGCDPTTGIERDGHDEGRCAHERAANQCCSPQNGAFTCVDADSDGVTLATMARPRPTQRAMARLEID